MKDLTKYKKLKKVLDKVLEHTSVCEDDLMYFADKYKITQSEFNKVFKNIEKLLNETITINKYGAFDNYDAHFKYNGRIYRWFLMIGQGAHCELTVIDD